MLEESSSSNGLNGGGFSSTRAERVWSQLSRRYQTLLDKTVIHGAARWASFAALLTLYWIRVWFSQSHYIVTYALHIYLLNLLIGFLSPAIDPETEGPTLPTTVGGGGGGKGGARRGDEEFRPFSRRLPEFKFWYACTRGTFASLVLTLFSFTDVPVFWPILLVYFIALFILTMRRQIAHMIKHRYIPCSWGKKRYGGGVAKTREALNVP